MSPIPLGILAAAGAGVAGSFDLLETQLISSNTASLTFDNLDTVAANYDYLQIRVVGRSDRSAGSENVEIRFNDVSTGYYEHRLRATGSVIDSAGTTFFGDAINAGLVAGGQSPSGDFGVSVVDILDFSSSTKKTVTRSLDGNVAGPRLHMTSNSWNNTSPITKMLVYCNSGASFVSGSRFSIYGIKAA